MLLERRSLLELIRPDVDSVLSHKGELVDPGLNVLGLDIAIRSSVAPSAIISSRSSPAWVIMGPRGPFELWWRSK